MNNDTLIKYTDEPGIFEITLPGEITNVERKAFDGCLNLKTAKGLNVKSIGRNWGNHEIKNGRKDLCLIFPEVDIAHEPAYTFKMALCLGFLKDEKLYKTYLSSYENYALTQKKWLLKSLIKSNSDELLLKALEFYKRKNSLASSEAEAFLSFALENDKTLSCAVLLNFKHSRLEPAGSVFDEFDL